MSVGYIAPTLRIMFLEDATIGKYNFKKYSTTLVTVQPSGYAQIGGGREEDPYIGTVEGNRLKLTKEAFGKLICYGSWKNSFLNEQFETYLGRTSVMLGEIPDVVMDKVIAYNRHKFDPIHTTNYDGVIIREPYGDSCVVKHMISSLNNRIDPVNKPKSLYDENAESESIGEFHKLG